MVRDEDSLCETEGRIIYRVLNPRQDDLTLSERQRQLRDLEIDLDLAPEKFINADSIFY